MIFVKVPLRVSIFGGGTDFPSFYKKEKFGSTLSFSINQYIYITLKRHSKIFKEKYRFNYSQTETCNSLNKIQNKIIREMIRYYRCDDRLYINTISDIPSSSGLGSSSSFIVGLMMAFNKYLKLNISEKKLLEQAANFEINILKKSIGKQDHYGCFYKGLNYIKYFDNELVKVESLTLTPPLIKIFNSIQFFWTKLQRESSSVLKEQNFNASYNREKLKRMRLITCEVVNRIKNKSINLEIFGRFLNESWDLKKKLSSNISNNFIDKALNIAINNSALGGKILGAGNGGFLMLLSKKKYHKTISKKMKKLGLDEYKFRMNEDDVLINNF